MFFRRGRLTIKQARALLVELFDQRYQWPLRMPIIHLLARGDPLRFLCSLRFVLDQIGEGIYLLNCRQPSAQAPWLADDLTATVAALPQYPERLAERVAAIMRLDDPQVDELDLRRLLLEIIDLTPKDKKQGHEAEEQSLVSWLPRIAALEAVPEPWQGLEMGQAQLRHLAQRAVRIVWRLPGSRLAVLTGSVAAGYADLTSDIDISLFGVKLAPVDVRRSLIAATSSAPTDITQLTQKTYASDAFWLQDRAADGGLHLIDVRYFLIEEAQRLIARPLPQSLAEHELLAHLSTADVLVDYEFRGPELIRDLQRATREARSERLARAADDLHRALDRLQIVSESTTIFYATTDAILAFFQLLAARNDRWILFPKWTAAWLDGLEHVPAAVHHRLSAVALLPSRPEHVAAKLETLRALESEVMAL